MEDERRRQAQSTIDTVRRLRLLLNRGMARRLAPSGINLPQFGAMALLTQLGEANMTVLTEELGTTMGAVTNLIDKLVFAGYVERRRSEADRRIVNVNMTAKGGEVLTESTESFVEYASEILARIDAAERDVFLKTYEHIVSVAEELSEQGAEANGTATDD